MLAILSKKMYLKYNIVIESIRENNCQENNFVLEYIMHCKVVLDTTKLIFSYDDSIM
jgi:hypothetical protein